MSEYKLSEYKSIVIKEAMQKIAENRYVLPAIQRKFVWRPKQIETLFDSIMRDYPINSFMMWEINNLEIQHNYKFYSFLKDYADRYAEENPEAPIQAIKCPFYAVIDGQQRLTSIYIGLYGTYRYKKPNKRYKYNEEIMPTRRLYLNIKKELNSSIDNENIYDFKFLTNDEVKNYATDNYCWFLVGDAVTKFITKEDIDAYIVENDLSNNCFAQNTLKKLWSKLNEDRIINFYVETEQNPDKILDIFLRTNSGGTPLTFSDLLMSISSANWKNINAREEIKKLKDEINEYGNPNFVISQDLILKNLLVLSDLNVQFKIKNFGRQNINKFEDNWENYREAILATFVLLDKLGFNDTLLRAKNATIPITYYIYVNNISKDIVKDNYNADDKKRIYQWLILTLLKGIFGGQSDSVIKDIRDVIREKSYKEYFPYDEIVEKFKGESIKNYAFDNNMLEEFMKEQYKSINGSLILYLLYPDIVLRNGKAIAQDHMHPKTFFTDKEKFNNIGFTDDDAKYCEDKEIWNSVLNLQLLSENDNLSKYQKQLKEWVKEKHYTNKDLLVNDEISLDIKEFKAFIENRKKNIISRLNLILNI